MRGTNHKEENKQYPRQSLHRSASQDPLCKSYHIRKIVFRVNPLLQEWLHVRVNLSLRLSPPPAPAASSYVRGSQ